MPQHATTSPMIPCGGVQTDGGSGACSSRYETSSTMQEALFVCKVITCQFQLGNPRLQPGRGGGGWGLDLFYVKRMLYSKTDIHRVSQECCHGAIHRVFPGQAKLRFIRMVPAAAAINTIVFALRRQPNRLGVYGGEVGTLFHILWPAPSDS